jgi:hypothetical protein
VFAFIEELFQECCQRGMLTQDTIWIVVQIRNSSQMFQKLFPFLSTEESKQIYEQRIREIYDWKVNWGTGSYYTNQLDRVQHLHSSLPMPPNSLFIHNVPKKRYNRSRTQNNRETRTTTVS